LDFENQRAIFGSQKGFGTIKMPVTGYDGSQKPFLVNLSSLLAIVSEFPVLELDGYTFKSGATNEFEIAHLDDDFEYPEFNSMSAKSFACSKEVISAIKRAGLYTDPDGNASLNGVFIINGSVAGTNKSRLCEEKLDELAGVDLNLPRSVWEIMALEVLGDNLTIDNSSADKFFVANGDEITIQFAISSALKVPPITDPRFVEKYNHSSFVKVNKAAFAQIVSFMSPFVASATATRMQMIISEDEIELKTEDGNQRISRKITPIETTPGVYNGDKIWVSNEWIKTILSSLEGETVVIQIDPASAALNFYTEEKPNLHIVYSSPVNPENDFFTKNA
jgi:hypothetical protein